MSVSVLDLRDRWAFGRVHFVPPAQRTPPASTTAFGADELYRAASDPSGLGRVVAQDMVMAMVVAGVGSAAGFLSPLVALLVLAAWLMGLRSTGVYRRTLAHQRLRPVTGLPTAVVRMSASFALLSLLVRELPVPALVAAGLVTAGATAVVRGATLGSLQARELRMDALVRGPAAEVAEFVRQMRCSDAPPFDVAAVQVTEGTAPAFLVGDEWRCVPAEADPVATAVQDELREVILVGVQPESSADLRRLVWRLEGHGITAHMAPIVADLAAPRVGTVAHAGTPLLSFDGRDAGAECGVSKVILDKVIAALLLVLLAPVMLGTAIAVRVTSAGPVLFRQIRVGRCGREFEMLKFRTMYEDAEARRHELEAANRHEGYTLFKVVDDPRVTALGRFMRKYSLDELPQLVNVLRGEMSIVGPRPPLPEEVANYPLDAFRRFRVRPGLTGLWQVSGRSDLDCVESARLDTHYVEQWSPQMDLTIIAKTPGAVISGKGAY